MIKSKSCNECKYKSDYSEMGCLKCASCKCKNGEHTNYEQKIEGNRK